MLQLKIILRSENVKPANPLNFSRCSINRFRIFCGVHTDALEMKGFNILEHSDGLVEHDRLSSDVRTVQCL